MIASYNKGEQNWGGENLEHALRQLLAVSGQTRGAGGRDIPEQFVSQPSSSHHNFTHQSKYL